MVKKTSHSASMPKNVFPSRTKYHRYSFAYISLFGVLAACYLALVLIPKPDKLVLRQLHLSLGSYHWLIATIIIILLIIWSASLLGSLYFKLYSYPIRKSADGRALNTISSGLIVLSVAQPLGSVLSSIVGLLGRHHPSWLPTLTIINNYVNIVLAAGAMFLIASGAERLYKLVNAKARLLPQRIWVLMFIIFSSLYSYFIVIQPLHTPLVRRAYFLPNWLLICTIAIPYLFIWYLGINAAFQINFYQKYIYGLLYKKALSYIAGGIALVIVTSVLTRLITTTAFRISQLSLTPLLLIIYGLLMVDAAGFILIAIGARKLRQMEEV